MVVRSLTLAASLALIPAGLAACSQDTPSPVDVRTVKLAVLAGSAHGGRPFSTAMTQEVHTTGYLGDPDGTGTALLTVNHGQREVCWEVAVANITLPATASHIHEGAPGSPGPAVVWLTPPGENGLSTGCVTVEDGDLLKSIQKNPDLYYVNVHNFNYPPGAVRGQLAK